VQGGAKCITLWRRALVASVQSAGVLEAEPLILRVTRDLTARPGRLRGVFLFG